MCVWRRLHDLSRHRAVLIYAYRTRGGDKLVVYPDPVSGEDIVYLKRHYFILRCQAHLQAQCRIAISRIIRLARRMAIPIAWCRIITDWLGSDTRTKVFRRQ